MSIASHAQDLLQNVQEWNSTSDDTARQRAIALATKIIDDLESPPEKLARIGWGEPSRTAALQAAFDLDIFPKLRDDPQSSAQLAKGTKADPLLVARILKHLCAYSIVQEVGKDAYVSTPFTLATSDPTMRGGLVYSFDGMLPAFHALPEFLRNTSYQVPRDPAHGPVQHALRTDEPFFAMLQSNARLGAAFNAFMTGYAKARPSWVDYYPVAERLLADYDGATPLVVDVGGGLGHDLCALHARHPNSLLMLQDTPTVIAQASPSLPESVTPLAHDFFDPQHPAARHARAYYLHLVLHDWSDEQAQAILRHLRDAMRPGYSRILINENVLRDVGAPWQQTGLDWTMMAMLVNRERTESQWRELICGVGLKVVGVWGSGEVGESVLEVVLADD